MEVTAENSSDTESKIFTDSNANSVNGENETDNTVVENSADCENESVTKLENSAEGDNVVTENSVNSENNSDEKVENSEEADNTEVEPLAKTENESVENSINSMYRFMLKKSRSLQRQDGDESKPENENSDEEIYKEFGIRGFKADLEYLNTLKGAEAIVDDQAAYEIIAYFRSFYNTELKAMIKESKTIEMLASVRLYLLEDDTIDFKSAKKIPDKGEYICRTTQNDRKVHNLLNIGYIMNQMISESVDLRIYFQTPEFIGANIRFLSKSGKKDYGEFKDIIMLIVFNLNWLSKEAENYKQIWTDLNTVQTLLEFNEHNSSYIIYVYSIIANISSDKELEEDISDKINVACNKLLETFMSYKESPRTYILYEIKDSDNKQKKFRVMTVYDVSNWAIVSLIGSLSSLYKLAVNGRLKKIIYSYPDFKETIEEFIYICSDVEREHALLLLAQLAFDCEIAQDLYSRKKLLDYIREQECREDFTFLKLKKTCQEFLWVCTPQTKQATPRSSQVAIDVNEQHVMISYNSASRNLCLKIKECLEKANHKVWMDVFAINGSSYESMSDAIENAKCVLMCVTEKYRQSVPCQLEAKYAMKLNKIIIPCIMQKGYGNVQGWLGMIMMDLIFVDFVKNEMDIGLEKLLNQINLRTNSLKKESTLMEMTSTEVLSKSENVSVSFESTVAMVSKAKSSRKTTARTRDIETSKSDSKKVSPTDNWSENEVEAWFKKNDLEDVHELVQPLDGKVLSQLNEIRIHTPEFFFKSLTAYPNTDMKAIALFSSLLKQLYIE